LPISFPEKFDADLTVVLEDGRRFHRYIEQVAGSAERPAGENAIERKFMGNAERLLRERGAQNAWRILTAGGDLDELGEALVIGSRIRGVRPATGSDPSPVSALRRPVQPARTIPTVPGAAATDWAGSACLRSRAAWCAGFRARGPSPGRRPWPTAHPSDSLAPTKRHDRYRPA